MEKFSTAVAGYKKEEVNKFVSDVIKQVEAMISDLRKKDEEIDNLKKDIVKYQTMRQSISDVTLNEENAIIEKARRNASRIVNEALLEAEKAQREAIQLKRNIITFKSRLRIILESQLDLVEEIEHLDL